MGGYISQFFYAAICGLCTSVWRIYKAQFTGVPGYSGTPNMMPIIPESVIIPTSLFYFLVQTNATKKPLSFSVIAVAILLATIFSIHGLDKMAVLVEWPVSIVIFETILGVIIGGVTSLVIITMLKRSEKAK